MADSDNAGEENQELKKEAPRESKLVNLESPPETETNPSQDTQAEKLAKLKPDFGAIKKKVQALSRKIQVAIAAGLVLLVGLAVYFFSTMPDRNYLQQIQQAKLSQYFANDSVALSQGKSFCEELKAGSNATGFKYQKIAVANFCSEFLSGFQVIPTPEEQQASLVLMLREKGLAGSFTSDLDAVNKAEAVCSALDAGGAQQGPMENFIAVKIYCDQYENGFRTLKDVKVTATFTITESNPDSWFPGIYAYSGGRCEGSGGYRDIDASTVVSVKNQDGDELATTVLGEGHGGYYKCVFTYSFTVLEGEKYYSVEVGKRGSLRFTEDQLKIPDELNSGLW